MESPITCAPRGERSLQSPLFTKLGNYFDRPEWSEEGAGTLDDFFDGDSTPADHFDQRLEDLLDSFEPLKVAPEPQRSHSAAKTDLQQDNHVAVAPAAANTFENPLTLSESHVLVKPISALNIINDSGTAIASSPVLTGTATSTRQTSPQLVLVHHPLYQTSNRLWKMGHSRLLLPKHMSPTLLSKPTQLFTQRSRHQ